MEREWFRLLLTVQGVGTRVALAILGTLKPGDLASAIALQDKAPALSGMAGADSAVARLQAELGEKAAPQPVADAVSALVNLGYGQIQASAAVAVALRDAGESAETAALIRLGLKELAQ
jgi:Holliday junction DNA helicase RuvA